MKKQKFLAALLALVMVLTLLPVTAFAAEGDEGETPNSGMEMNKNTVLQADGTYTITLEAYATGSTLEEVITTGVPLDIVLVLDQSGSMAYNDGGSSTNTESSRRYYKLRQAVTDFVANIKADAKEKDVDHKLAIIGFAANSSGNGSSITGSHDSPGSSTGAWRNTGLFVNGTLKNYQTSSNVYTAVNNVNNYGTYYILNGTEYQRVYYCNAYTTDDHEPGWFTQSHGLGGHRGQAVSPKTSANDTNTSHVQFYTQSQVTNNLTAQDYRNGFVSVYDTANDQVTASITTAIGKIAANGGTYTQYGLEMARQVFANNPQRDYTKADGTTGKSPRIVVLFTDGDTDSSENTLATESNTLKSTYGATIYSVAFGTSLNSNNIAMLQHVSSNYSSDVTYSRSSWGGTSLDTKYYMTATNKSELDNIFSTITKNELTPSTSVTLDGGSVMKDILSDEFTLPAGYSADSSITVKTQAGTANAAGNITWGAVTENPAGVIATANVAEGIVEVTGFDYSANYITNGHPGAKLIVTIEGVHPTADAFTGAPVYTNNPNSGIYEEGHDDEPFQSFDTPSATLYNQSYVLDYAKPVTVNASDWGQGKLYALMSEAGAVTGASNAATGNYGDATSTDTTITYFPKTMNWKGYDSFFTFDNTEKALSWAKINFIPANNVYYEDSFVTNGTNGTTIAAGIEFSANYQITTGTNGEQVDTDVHGGWKNTDLADDLTSSDGTAVEMTAGATASFTFTGTGVDVYTRTNASSGAVRGKLYTVSEVDGTTTAKLAKVLYVDNLAVSGDYYQIPSLSFSGLEHGTYKLELTVYSPTDANETARSTYYLDGIRIYNPLSAEQEADSNVSDSYTETDDQNNVTSTELNALFTEVRDILITAGNFNAGDTTVNGVVFIDDIDKDGVKEDGESTDVIGTYEELGPKNEVYLAEGQSIAFKVNGSSSNFYALGLKAPAGETKAEITNGNNKSELDIGHSTDLYYAVEPNKDGIIVVKNTGSNLLSITKLKTTSLSASSDSGIMVASLDALLGYAIEFDSLPVVAYSLKSEPEVEEPEVTEPEETEPEVTEPEETEPEVPEIDVEIETPKPQPKPEQKPVSPIVTLVKKLFSFISKWF